MKTSPKTPPTERTIDVTYSVSFKTTIKVPVGESINDAVSDIDIPESKDSIYQYDSFCPDNVVDAITGEEIDLDEVD